MKAKRNIIIFTVLLSIVSLGMSWCMKSDKSLDKGFHGTYVFDDKRTMNSNDPMLVIFNTEGNDNTYLVYNYLNEAKAHGIARKINEKTLKLKYGPLEGYYLIKEDNQYNLISNTDHAFLYKYNNETNSFLSKSARNSSLLMIMGEGH